MARATKISNVLQKVRESVSSGRYYDTSHASQRKTERNIALPHVLYVLKNGYHEKKKDEFKSEYNDWTYAIRGKTIDGRDIRIAVAFDEHDMLIITVIEIKVSQR
ncbi:MAG: DUF4258 domain-containing protein [Verrucomicrobia bacterium]|nr:DUF4258 domain-containing protein [Verrucomicrobiota bacterium]